MFVVLSLILMRENNMDENELLSFLERIGIYGKLKKNHPLIEGLGFFESLFCIIWGKI